MFRTTDKIQILVATMYQKDFSKVEQMNIHSDVIFANQDDTTKLDIIEKDSFTAKMITTDTRGVGINRNIALHYASGDILLIADDDMVYADDYEKMVYKAFKEHPDADAIIFNINTIGGQVDRRVNKKSYKVSIFNALNYGAARIAVKRSSLLRERIMFSACFGGGTSYSAGEDSLFIRDMLKCGFRIYTSSDVIATVEQSTSTWFRGYTKKFFYDKGAFYKAAFGRLANLFCLQDLLRHKKMYKNAEVGICQAYLLMKEGICGYQKLQEWEE